MDTPKKAPEYSAEQVQKAKDFIWDYLEDGVRQFIISMAEKSPLERKELYLNKILVRMEAKQQNSYLIHEKLIIAPQYSPELFPSKMELI